MIKDADDEQILFYQLEGAIGNGIFPYAKAYVDCPVSV